MDEGRRRWIPFVAALAQVAMCVFFISVYFENRDRLEIVIFFDALLGISALLLFLRVRWALTAAVAINSLLVLVFWASALERGSPSAFGGAAVFSIPWLLITPYWWWQRRRRETKVQQRVAAGIGPEEAAPSDDDSGWSKEMAGGRAKFALLVGFGALCLVAGMGIAADESVAAGIFVTAFGVALLAAAPMFRSWDRSGRVVAAPVAERGGEAGFLFPYSRFKSVSAGVSGLGMAAAFAGMGYVGLAERDEPQLGLVAFGFGGALLFGFFAVTWLRRNGMRGGYIALLEAGIFADIGMMRSFVPWDVITAVDEVETTTYTRGARVTEPFVGLTISDLDRVEMSYIARKLSRVNRWLAADVNYPVRTLDVDPHQLLDAIRRYWQNPDTRAELRSGGSDLVSQ